VPQDTQLQLQHPHHCVNLACTARTSVHAEILSHRRRAALKTLDLDPVHQAA
jgi:hypothetical protein